MNTNTPGAADARAVLIEALDRYLRQDETAGDIDNGVYRGGLAAMSAALSTPASVVGAPSGWVPLRIEYEPGYPEDVAFGPQVMMDRLKKWLDKYFAMVAAPSAAAPSAATGAIDAREQEPTEEMLTAGRSVDVLSKGWAINLSVNDVREIYLAMRKAKPASHDEAPAPSAASAQQEDSYVSAFYELAKLMGIAAQPISPERVWREQMLPRLQGVEELLTALRMAVLQNSHDMLMTGEELRQCERAILKAAQGVSK